MTDYADIPDGRIKHLEMVQAVIARLGTNGFVVKGWAITVAGAFYGFAISEANELLAVASLVPTSMFWLLDSSFLRSERLFRILFDHVRGSESATPFFMGATSGTFRDVLSEDEKRSTSRWRTFWRPTLTVLYGGLIAVAAIVVVVAAGMEGDSPTTPWRHRW